MLCALKKLYGLEGHSDSVICEFSTSENKFSTVEDNFKSPNFCSISLTKP